MLVSCACIFFLLFGVHHQFLIGTPSAQLLLKRVKNKEKPLQKHCGTRYGFTFHVWIFRLGKKIQFPHSFQGNRYANTAGVSARRGSGKTGPLKKQKKLGQTEQSYWRLIRFLNSPLVTFWTVSQHTLCFVR